MIEPDADRRRHVGRRRFVGGRGAARRAGPRRHRSVDAAVRPDATARRRFGSCCTLDDLHDARRVAARDRHPALHRQLRAAVRRAGRLELRRASTPPGRTPIPCAHCNSDLKFATLRRARARASAPTRSRPATTRASSATRRPAATCCKRGVDRGEGSVVLPVLADAGAARARACSRSATSTRRPCASRRARLGLPVADKPDSQEICFVPDGDYAAFVEQRGAGAPRGGAIRRRRAATSLGQPRRHPPLHRRPAQGPRALVARSRSTSSASTPTTQQVDGRPARGARAHDADRVGRELDRRRAAGARVARHRADPPSPPGGAGDDRAARRRRAPRSTFDAPQIAVTPGQAVVFYDGDVVRRRRMDRLRSAIVVEFGESGEFERPITQNRRSATISCRTLAEMLRDVRRGSARRRARPCSRSRRR